MNRYPVSRLSLRTGPSQLLALAPLLFVAGCAAPPAPPPSNNHLLAAPAVAGKAPDFATAAPLPRPPRPAPKQEVYSVVMQNVSVQDLLFALARDAKLNVDIHPSIHGTVTMNVRDQTMTEILDRVARQVDLRYELNGRNLSILPDAPYLKLYHIDYPNIQRDATTSISTSTNVASTGTAPGAGAGAGGGGGSNASTSQITNTTNNRFWETLVANIKDLLHETDKLIPEKDSAAKEAPGMVAQAISAVANGGKGGGKGAAPTSTLPTASSAPAPRVQFREAASVITNPETGNISVRATQSQHVRVAEFLDKVMRSARRQVLIEATIVEVDLSNRFQQGIDWSLVRSGGTSTDPGISIKPVGPVEGLRTGGMISSLISLTRTDYNVFDGRDLTMMLSMLESFGTLRVLSSPKISVLNNQSSVLKVVDNKVYFTLEVTPGTPATASSPATAAIYTTTINTVPIGFLMSVTPQISEAGEVTLNLRPTISRITGYAVDPSPALAPAGVTNRIPEVQTREMESIMRVQSGNIAVLGGLMQDSRNKNSDEVPLANRLPWIGNLFKYRDDTDKKTELVIFLRPTVLQDASLDGDYRNFRNVLKDSKESMNDPLEPGSVPYFQGR